MAKKETHNAKEIFDKQILFRIFEFVKPYIGRFYLLIFLTILVGILAPLLPWLIQYTVDNSILQNDAESLIQMTLIMIVLAFLQALVQFSHTYLSGWLGQQIIHDIRMKLFSHLTHLQLKFYDKTPIGRLVTRNISDVETLSNVFTNGLAAMVGDLLQLIFILGIMFYTDWKLTLISLAAFPLLIVSTYIFKEKIKSAFNDVRTAVSNLNTFVQEHITGMAIVQIFNTENKSYQKFEEINKEHRKAHMRSVKYYSIYFPVAEVIGAIGTGLLVWYGARSVLAEHLTLGTLIAFIMYIGMFFRPIRMIADRFNTLQMGIVSSSRILNILDQKEQIQNTGQIIPQIIEGNVKFENVFFAYNEDSYVLKDISFKVKKGETVALVGATGAGKSSVINLLSRLYEINQGRIEVDGIEIHDYEISALRRHIGVVLQDVFLFSGSIRENITLNNAEISEEKIWEAAELVGARKFIERLPEGFDYKVMERGSTLSVGQRQLISFVRAMVYNPSVLILDEATSSVDTETEELIQKATQKLTEGRTSIVIAHRLSTIRSADKIIVLDKGEIKEIGTHQELLAKNGFYADLHRMQYKELVA